jgi:MFS family permease
VIVASLFLWSGVTWLTAHATTFPELLATRVLMGLGEACYIPAALALIADYHRGSTRSLATGMHMIGISLGQGLGGLGGLLAERHDWTYPFTLFGGIGVVYSIVLLSTLRDVPPSPVVAGAPVPERIGFGAAVRHLFREPSYRLALVYWGLVSVGTWAVMGWLPTLLGERFNLSQGTAGLSATGYLQPAAWAGLIIGGILSDRASRSNARGRLYVTMLGMAIAAPSIWLGANATVLWAAIAGFMLWSFGLAFVNANMMPILCLIAPERSRATGYGILNLCSTSIGGITIYLGGALRDANISVTVIFNASVFILFVCIALLYVMKLPQPTNPKA